jgi:uncharacterized protein (TIGR02145 family)
MENFGGTDVEVPLQYSHNTSSDTAHWEALIIPHLAMDVPGDRVFTFKFAGDEERPWAVEDLEGKKIDFEAGQNYQYSFIVKEKTITTSDGMSNCYMVAPNTTLKFPVKRAYADATTLRTGDAFADGTFQVKVLWQDPANLLTSPTTTLANASGTGPMAEVSVTTASGKTGNAVIGIYKSSDTTKPVWSYHIWVTDPDEIVPWENTKQTAAKYIFMDRNLGATAAANSIAGRGLLYQWGRKDPFPGGPNKAGDAGAAGYAALSSFEGLGTTKKVTDSSYAGTDKTTAAQIIASIKHPTVFFSSVANGDWLSTKDDGLWNVTSGSKRIKSIYDPCPEGWRVPEHVGNSGSEANSPWKSLTTNAFIEGDSGGATFEASKNHSYYPAAGYRSSSGGSFDYGGNSGVYWSASVTGGNGYYLYFRYYGNVAVAYSSLRANGFSVRCVQES